MAKPLSHELNYGDTSLPKGLRLLSYGKCTRSPYVENKLWFVMIPRGYSRQETGPREYIEPEQDHTFLVSARYARPSVMDEWKRDITKWSEVAHKVVIGNWCSRYECLWRDVPVYKHQLPSGRAVKYGYCRTQPREYPDRELWYVALRHCATYVVDHICANPAFIDRLGHDTLKWEIICWCKLEHEVRWDDLETGTTAGSVRESDSIALDSPHLPFSLEDVVSRVTTYEEEIPELVSAYGLDGGRKFLSRQRRRDWQEMSTQSRARNIRQWEAETGKQIITFR